VLKREPEVDAIRMQELNLTESVHKVVWQESISAQIRQLILYYY
jgi:hypothetical protein